MQRLFRLAALTIAVLVVALAPTSAAADLLSSTVAFDQSLRLHPHLQYGAASEPDKKVRAIVQKVDPAADSGLIAAIIGAKVLEEFAFIGSFVIEAPLSHLPLLAADPGVAFVSPDGPVLGGDPGQQAEETDTESTVSESPEGESAEGRIDTGNLKTAYPFVVRATDAWNAPEFEVAGEGVTVAIVDTGVSDAHADLSGRVLAVNTNPRASHAGDTHGHGTHVAGIIAGYDASGTTGEYIGIAPTSRVIGVKIADDNGVARESDLIRGLQWVYEHREEHKIRAVNLSVRAGTPSSYVTSPTAAAAERLWFSGVVVVVAAGNEGAALGAGWYAPANDPYVITVGCLDDAQTRPFDDDSGCTFSSRGSTAEAHAKPDVVAPGRRIVSALASSSATLAEQFPGRITDDRYIRMSGTSMAAPVVTGAVALLLEEFPSLTPDQVKWLLGKTARTYPGQPDGAGLVDVYTALEQAASGNVESANQPLLRSGGRGPIDAPAVWTAAYWDAAYWDAAYWDAAYWDAAYWDGAYWD
jgi:serine protease AprX